MELVLRYDVVKPVIDPSTPEHGLAADKIWWIMAEGVSVGWLDDKGS